MAPIKNSIQQEFTQRIEPLNLRRVFIAILPPAKILQELEVTQNYLKQELQGRFVKKENIHSTLLYIGNVESSLIPLIAKTIENLKLKPFAVTLQPLEYAGDRNHQMIWAPLASNDLPLAMQLIKDALAHATIQTPHEHEFRPHLTLVRLKPHSPQIALELANVQAEWLVDSLILFESVHDSSGITIYKELFSIPLKAQ